MKKFLGEQEDKHIKSYSPKVKEEKVIQSVIKTYEAYEDNSQEYRSEFEDIYKAWRLYLDGSRYPWRSKLFIPVIFWTIETIAPRLLSDYPTWKGKPVGPEDEIKADFVSKLLDFQCRNTMDMRKKLIQTAKSMLLYGKGIGKIYWKTEQREYSKKKKFLKVFKYQKKHKEVIYDDPVYEPCSVFDVYVDPKVNDIKDSPWVIHRFEMDVDELKKKDKIYDNLEYIKGSSEFLGKNDANASSSTIDAVDFKSSGESGTKKTIVLEAWSNDRVVTLGDAEGKAVLLRDIPNDRGEKPFVSVSCFDSPEANRYYTPGIGKILLDIQAGINTTSNQMVDNINLTINRMFKIKRGANIDRQQLISRPGGAIEMDEMDDLQELRMNDSTAPAKYLMDQFLYWAQNTSGATDMMRGLEGGDTATQASIQDKNANNRMSILQNNMEEYVSDVGRMVLRLDQQNIQDTRTLRIFDEQDRQDVYVTFEDGQELNGEFDIEVLADSTQATDKTVLNKQLLDSIELFGKSPEFGLKLNNIARRWYENAGFDRIDDIVKTENEANQSMMQEQAAQGPQQGMPPEQGPPPQEQGPDMAALADEENQRMMQGEQLPPTEGATPEHTMVHEQFMQQQGGNELIDMHAEGETQAMEAMMGEGQQQPPPLPMQGPLPQGSGSTQRAGGLSYTDQVKSAYSPINQV